MSEKRIAVLDVDGTLVDSNYQHAMAWYRALRSLGETFPIWRIHRLIGMGGDKLVTSLGGEELEARIGDEARERQGKEVDALLDEIAPLPGARDLLVAIKERGHRLVLASSGQQRHVDFALDLLDARDLADDWTSSADADATKPAPDLLQVALKKLGAPAGRAQRDGRGHPVRRGGGEEGGDAGDRRPFRGVRGRRTARRRRGRDLRHPGRPHADLDDTDLA